MVTRQRRHPARGTSGQIAAYNRFVLARDEYTCRVRLPGICIGIASTVDHIRAVSEAPWLALDPDNGRASCVPCNRAKGTLPDAYLPREFPPSRDW